jgi:hypothetical protein
METTRSKAISWWNAQHISAKNFLAEKYNYGRILSSLTGREIELIYNKEHNNV